MTPLHTIRNQQDIVAYRRRLHRQLRKKESRLQQDVEEVRASLTVSNFFSLGTSYLVRNLGSHLSWFLTGYSLFRRIFSKK